MDTQSPTPPRGRLILPDLVRAVALIGMAAFHFTFDLENFGFAPPGTIFSAPWMNFARLVAGTFVFMAGLSLVLAHRRGFRAGPFWRRLGKVAGAAALVSAATYVMMPQVFIYYGILHSIAVSSLIGAALLWLPWPVLAALGAGAIWIHLAFVSPAFDHPWLWWLGLSTHWRPSMDFEPVFPWLGPFLWGMAAAKLFERTGLWARAARYRPEEVTGALKIALFAGRHTLPIYLIHQPVLYGLVWAAYMLHL
ncbi:DUF1624 domain-containing protein [Thioclava atlantica]|uniref:Heparan-alpha-glucosaminide N-acetyltransferase catalytic domain-containing protein n=1 Tax=Thioclava atlantica TaxID=1317124 RepID=A0A085TTS7_9RHOB|nr:heparan-alpha-glucosaminide N-acetyltransferase [Thioclava atlantica]KFE34124.1 hypothetical protein DW2_14025 [Thioclava atlantica]